MKILKPRIYVACLAAYNNGYLHGEWIDANQNTDALYEQIRKILIASPVPHSEEFAVHDFEDFGEYRIEEYENLDTISNIAAFVSEHGELGAAVLAHSGGNTDDATRLLEENYHGEHKNEEEFAYYWTHEVACHEIPKHLEHYIDYKAMARDFFTNDFFSIELDNIHVFSYY